MNFMQILRVIWAGPWTIVGIFFGMLGVFTGGGMQCVDGVLEFHGGLLRWLLRKAPIGGGAAAMTVGHAVLGQTVGDLERTRSHERIHVHQYERWGPFFVPAYFGSSAWVWVRGGHPYLDNPFEVEAYEKDGLGRMR